MRKCLIGRRKIVQKLSGLFMPKITYLSRIDFCIRVVRKWYQKRIRSSKIINQILRKYYQIKVKNATIIKR